MRGQFQYTEKINTIEGKIIIHREEFDLPMTTSHLRQLRDEDEFCSKLREQLNMGTLQSHNPYYLDQYDILCKYVDDDKQRFGATVLLHPVVPYALWLAHDDLGHNGTIRTYMMLRRTYYWCLLKPTLEKYGSSCTESQKRN